MSDNYSAWHPGSLIHDSAERYRELIRNKRQKPRPRLEGDQAELYTQASTLICPADTRFRHLIDTNTMTCARCNASVAAILERQPV